MSTKGEPLLSDEWIYDASKNAFACEKEVQRIAVRAREIYEDARAKDAELIQQLVDALADVHEGCTDYLDVQDALEAAASAGFKRTEP